jgi:hypothetical protein
MSCCMIMTVNTDTSTNNITQLQEKFVVCESATEIFTLIKNILVFRGLKSL